MKDQTYYLLLGLAIGVYSAISKLIFDHVYETSKIVVDELFHIPQGVAYCENNFTKWDPKITTLPGLYLISSSIAGNFFQCTTYYLRIINLGASVINLCLFASIIKFIYGRLNDSNVTVIVQAINLTLLPPLYFFSHIYYTDTLSLTFLLILFRLCLVNKHKVAILVTGIFSILMRQTNVLWIAMVLGRKLLDIFIKSSRVYGNIWLNKPPPSPLNKNKSYMESVDKSHLKCYYNFADFITAVKYHFSNFLTTYFRAFTTSDFKIVFTLSAMLVGFLVFVIINGSIVVGDKTAHMASLHLAQMLYFLLFYGIFGLPYVLNSSLKTLRLLMQNKLYALVITVAFLAIVHFNTIIHPYLLADNRHYTFYLWSRWFNKYWFAKYVTVPVYTFLFYSLYANLKDQNCISFLLPYLVCSFAAMGLQRMIEVRYFLVPYLVLRLRFVRPSNVIVATEFLWYILINSAAFYIFFTKEFMWSDFKETQRIIW